MLPPGCEVIRSKRKTVAIQIADDGHMIVRAPLRAANSSIAEFIRKNEKWIAAHTAEALRDKREIDNIGAFTAQDIRKMAEKAMKVIPERVRYYAEKLGVTYGRITIRNQKTKWGSCTAEGNLNFNCLLMAAPPEVLDAVVVHELCHRMHMDHSKAFYAEVYRVYPEYDKWNNWLKTGGKLLIRRMLAGQG
ncbi:MAG: M48 family metallopeptidase [Ruminococcus sp.]|nr:M48 family metallopeptidase [Ruminococcus sp.]